jgi:hypothetical protein
MVPQQVLREPGGLTRRRAALAALFAIALAAPAALAEPVVVVDLRVDEDRAQIRAELSAALRTAGVEPVADAALAAALTGDDAEADAARAALAAARAALEADDCRAAAASADTAILGLAALEAAGREVRGALREAYAVVLRCADRAGHGDAAMAAAAALRALGAAEPPAPPPADLDAELWSRYPAMDAATNVGLAQVSIDTVPPGATVWIDHRRAGVAPLTVTVRDGRRLIAAAGPTGRVARRVRAAEAGRVSMSLPPRPPRWHSVGARVAAWRDGATEATAVEIGQLLAEVGVRVAVVLPGDDSVEIWGAGAPGEAARRLGTGSLAESAAAATLVARQVGARPPRAPDPDVPLLVEDPAARDETTRPDRQKWWVYASIIGAVGLAGAVILANDLANDRQRIELTWP